MLWFGGAGWLWVTISGPAARPSWGGVTSSVLRGAGRHVLAPHHHLLTMLGVGELLFLALTLALSLVVSLLITVPLTGAIVRLRGRWPT